MADETIVRMALAEAERKQRVAAKRGATRRGGPQRVVRWSDLDRELARRALELLKLEVSR